MINILAAVEEALRSDAAHDVAQRTVDAHVDLVDVCAGEAVARDAELHRHRRASREGEAYRRARVGGEGAAVDAARCDGCVVEVHGDDAPVCGLEGARDFDAQRGGAAEDEDSAGREWRALAKEVVWL